MSFIWQIQSDPIILFLIFIYIPQNGETMNHIQYNTNIYLATDT